MNWKFENTGFRSGVFNMEYDSKLAQMLIRGAGNPTIRVYGWQPPAISLGWNQSPESVDTSETRAAGIDVVRRPTGGRAILHSEELTYSVVMRVKNKNVLSVYDEISRSLVAGLNELGVPAMIEKSQPEYPSLYKTPSGAACFSSTGRYEIKCHGRKLVGSAQRRYSTDNGEEVVLQHGSILLGPDHKRLVNFLKFKSEEQREFLRRELDDKTIDLSEVMNRKITFLELSDRIFSGFKKSWSITPESGDSIYQRQARA